MASYNFSKKIDALRIHSKTQSGSLGCLLVFMLTLISVNLISKVSQLSLFVVLAHIL